MPGDDNTLTCSVCGQEIKPSEPVVQTDEGRIAHVRCVRGEQRPPAEIARRALA